METVLSILSDAIRKEELSGSAADVLASLLAEGVLSTDTTSYSLSGTVDKLASLGVDTGVLINLRYLIRTLPIGGDTLEGMLLTAGGDAGGVDYSRYALRLQLLANQAHSDTTAEQQTAIAGLLQIGIRTGALWKKYVPSEPTESTVQAALDEIAAEDAAEAVAVQKQQLRVWLRQRCDEIDLAIISDLLPITQEAVKSAWAE
jgi:hypothetical protein